MSLFQSVALNGFSNKWGLQRGIQWFILMFYAWSCADTFILGCFFLILLGFLWDENCCRSKRYQVEHSVHCSYLWVVWSDRDRQHYIKTEASLDNAGPKLSGNEFSDMLFASNQNMLPTGGIQMLDRSRDFAYAIYLTINVDGGLDMCRRANENKSRIASSACLT